MTYKKTIFITVLVMPIVTIFFLLMRSSVYGVSLSASTQVTVGATYYGGEYNGQWVIDNANQCTRIANGEFTAASLNAVVDSSCDDDNGLTYQNDIPLHNTVSFAELSNDAGNPDYAALGGLPAGTRVEIEYKSKCVVAEKRDVGQGGSSVNGHLRAIDLWWQTARSLGFTNGFDTVKVRLAGSSPLSPLGKTSVCKTVSKPVPKPVAPIEPAPQPQQQGEVDATVTQTEDNQETSEQKPAESHGKYYAMAIGVFVGIVSIVGYIVWRKLHQSKHRGIKKRKTK